MWFGDVVIDLPWFTEKKGKLGKPNISRTPASQSQAQTSKMSSSSTETHGQQEGRHSRVMAANTTGKLLAGTPEVAIAGTEADLCLSGDVPDDFWQALEASSERFARLGYSVLSASHRCSSVRKDSSIIRSRSCSVGMPAKLRMMSSLA